MKSTLENQQTAPQPEALLQAGLVEISTREGPPPTRQRTAVDRLRLWWEGRRTLCRAALAGFLVGTILAFVLPKRFQSTTLLMPPDAQPSSALTMAALASRSGMGGLGDFAGDLLGLKSPGALFVGILRSQTVEDRIIDRFNLNKVYWTQLPEDTRRKLTESTSISEDRNSGIISITVTDGDPKRAAAMAQAYAEELDHLVAELSTSAAHRERVFLEERLQTVKQELDQASQDLSRFESKNAAIDIKEQGKAMVDAAATLMGQLIAAKSELKGLEPIYTTNNVRVQSVQSRIAELNRELEKMGRKEDPEAGDPNNSEDPFYPSIRKLPLLGETYADLYRRTKIKEIVYETLTQQYELAKVQEAKETPRVKVLDVARLPQKKSFPPRLLIMVLCTVLCLMGGAVLILAQAQWNEIDGADPAKVLAQEVFQTIQAGMPRTALNSSRLQAMTHWLGTWF
jgi:capsule polysaccharide export protein KpsE/RkpR